MEIITFFSLEMKDENGENRKKAIKLIEKQESHLLLMSGKNHHIGLYLLFKTILKYQIGQKTKFTIRFL